MKLAGTSGVVGYVIANRGCGTAGSLSELSQFFARSRYRGLLFVLAPGSRSEESLWRFRSAISPNDLDLCGASGFPAAHDHLFPAFVDR
jgi:hypothetical protein